MVGMNTQKLWEEAIWYCEKFNGALRKKAIQYLPFSSGLDISDFISEAQIVCFKTLQNLSQKECTFCQKNYLCSQNRLFTDCSDFLKKFWGEIKTTFYNMKDSFLQKNYKKRLTISEFYEEESICLGCINDYQNIITSKEEDLERKKEIWKKREEIFANLNENEKKIIFLLEQGKTLKEIQKILNYKKIQGLYMCIKRIRKKLNYLEEPETRKEVTSSLMF